MKYVYRNKSAFIELDPNQEILYKLPPISEGMITINAYHSERDFSGVPPQNRSIPRWGGITIHRTGMQTVAIQDDNNGDEGGGDVGPARDLKLELRHSNHLSVSHNHSIIATSNWSDDLWRLKIKRVQDPSIPSNERRKYRIQIQYMSLLPEIERRIPVQFFQNNFNNNWNNEKYVGLSINGSKLIIYVRPDFQELYNLLPQEIDFGTMLNFRNLYSENIELGAGAGPVKINPQGDSRTCVFFSIRFDIHGGDVDLNVPIPGGFEVHLLTIPNFTMYIRFYLVGAPFVEYIPIIDLSDLIRHIPEGVEGLSITALSILREFISDKLKDAARKIELLQYESGNPQGISKFGSFFTPWLVGGDYELLSISYSPGTGDVFNPNGIINPATGDLTVTYAGPREPEPPIIIAQEFPDEIDDGSLDLFLTPFEINIPITARPRIGVHPFVPRPGSMEALQKIDHIIVLMQENRSFDQVLGYLSREGGREYLRISDLNQNEMINNKVIGLAPDGHLDRDQQVNEFGTIKYFPKKANLDEPPRESITGWAGSTSNPAHGIEDISLQIDGGTMKGFIKSYARRIGLSPSAAQSVGGVPELRNVMNYFTGEHLEIYTEIVKHFGICDRWYSSIAGGTLPNRYLTLTGRLNVDRFGLPEEKNPDVKSLIPSELPTLFDYLELYGKKWRVYEHGYCFTRLFGKYTYDTTNILPFEDREKGFEAAAKSGDLPEFTLIEPNYIELPPGNDDHAPADMKDGQKLVERIVRAVVNSPKWSKILLIITYDEHGGFYDHVPPPLNYPHIGGNTQTLGVRVPTFVISPLIKPGRVFHRHFDHTSIGATVLRRFCRRIPGLNMPTNPPFLSERMESAYDLSEVLELANSPVPRFDFGIFGRPLEGPIERPTNFVDTNNSNSLSTDDPRNDFHWVLRIARLFTGFF